MQNSCTYIVGTFSFPECRFWLKMHRRSNNVLKIDSIEKVIKNPCAATIIFCILHFVWSVEIENLTYIKCPLNVRSRDTTIAEVRVLRVSTNSARIYVCVYPSLHTSLRDIIIIEKARSALIISPRNVLLHNHRESSSFSPAYHDGKIPVSSALSLIRFYDARRRADTSRINTPLYIIHPLYIYVYIYTRCLRT